MNKSTLHTHVTSVLAEMLDKRNFNGVAVNWNQVEADTHVIESVSPQIEQIFTVGVSQSSITVRVGEVDIPTASFGVDIEDLTIKNIESIAKAVEDISACMGVGIPASAFSINTRSGNAFMYHPYDVAEVNKLRDLIKRANEAGCPLSQSQIRVMLGSMREGSASILRNYLLGLRIKEDVVDGYMSPVNQESIVRALALGGASSEGNTHLFTLDAKLANRITIEQATEHEMQSAIACSKEMADGADDAFALLPLSALFSYRHRLPVSIALMVRQTKNNEVYFAAFLLVEEDSFEDSSECDQTPVLIACYDHLGDHVEVEEREDGSTPDFYCHWTTPIIDIAQDRHAAMSDYIICLLNGTKDLGGQYSEYIRANRSNLSQARYRTGVMTAIHNKARA